MGEKAIVLVVVGLLFLAMLAAAGEADAKGESTAYHAALAARHHFIERAQAAARRDEARVRRWARRWARQWGRDVGRWAHLALDVGWPEREMHTLGYVIWRESRGQPGARNGSSGCAGLLQIHPCHGAAWVRAFDPRQNLRYGLRLWRESGWRPWGL